MVRFLEVDKRDAIDEKRFEKYKHCIAEKNMDHLLEIIYLEYFPATIDIKVLKLMLTEDIVKDLEDSTEYLFERAKTISKIKYEETMELLTIVKNIMNYTNNPLYVEAIYN